MFHRTAILDGVQQASVGTPAGVASGSRIAFVAIIARTERIADVSL